MERKVMKVQGRQGDVLLVRFPAKIKLDKLVKVEPKGGMVIHAYGEQTGHNHCTPAKDTVAYQLPQDFDWDTVQIGEDVDYWGDPAIRAYFQKYGHLMEVKNSTFLEHQTHDPIEIDCIENMSKVGINSNLVWIVPQTEYHPEEIRRVSD
jgi:hypothetical protein